MNHWRPIPDGTLIMYHWLEAGGCKWCGFNLRAMTSAKPGGAAWYWNGRGEFVCPGGRG